MPPKSKKQKTNVDVKDTITEAKANRIKRTLDKYANDYDTEKALVFIRKNLDLIGEIILKYGCEYDISYKNRYFEFTSKYQKIIESINPNALFEDDD